MAIGLELHHNHRYFSRWIGNGAREHQLTPTLLAGARTQFFVRIQGMDARRDFGEGSFERLGKLH